MATAALAATSATPCASPRRVSPRHPPFPLSDATGTPAVANTPLAHLNPGSRIGKKLAFNKTLSSRSPLKINIPTMLPPSRMHASPASPSWRGSNSATEDSGSEESEDIDEPTTPRNGVDVVTPHTPDSYNSTPGCSPNPFDSCGLHISDELEAELGSLRLSAAARSSRLVLSPFSPARQPLPLHAARNASTGSERIGAFRFMRMLNRGTFGVAYTARELATGRVMCAKVCMKDGMRDDEIHLSAVSAELAAYKLISRADESSRKWLMELHGVVQDPERIVFLMDLMSSDMFTMVEKHVEKRSVVRWIAQIALGIDALHQMGIIHRDIKPENILHTPGNPGRIRIADFTNAWTSPGDCPEERARLHDTQPGAPLNPRTVYSKKLIGTKEYLAPEMWRREWYGVMVDWWALGCLVYDLIVGDILFPDDRAVLAYTKWQRYNTRASFFSSRARYLTAAEIDLVAGLTHVLPERRYRLKHLLRHPYFVDRSTGCSVFDEVRSTATPTCHGNALGPFPSLAVPAFPASTVPGTPVDPTLPDMAMFHPTTIRGDAAGDALFEEFDWVNPCGVWGSPSSPR